MRHNPTTKPKKAEYIMQFNGCWEKSGFDLRFPYLTLRLIPKEMTMSKRANYKLRNICSTD